MNAKLKVVTITLNPALDLTGSLAQLQVGSVNLMDSYSMHPAGKGINVAKVLADLGAEVTATGLLGAGNQEPFVKFFESLNITDQFIRVPGNTRINVKIVEKSGQVSDLNFPGIVVNQHEINQFEHTLFTLAASHDAFVIAGSLPLGLSPQQLTDWIDRLQRAGKKVFFDSSNDALIAGIKASPYLIKPNDHELSSIVGQPLDCLDTLLESGKKLYQQGCKNVVISLGEEGVIWIDQTGVIKSIPKKMAVVSTVGAGDTLVAGLCWAELNHWDKAQSLSFATALAALAVTQIGVGVDDVKHVKALQEQIHITTQLHDS